jgi:eukaryotic-like serine/threonine-protein kinase
MSLVGALRPGQMLEGTSYQVVREIGAGGMGVVYEIEHVRLRKRYVAKVIHDQIRNEEGAAKRMEREAQVLAAISHPNIVQVHDVGTTADGVSYFVMEKLEGVDLRHTMKKHGVRRTRSIEIIADVLEALDYVHRRGIVHRDIKPENIFLAEQPQGTVTKVLDFGIVHIFDSDGRVSQGRITKTGGFVGTLYYAAPEQMQGKAAGPPNDVYAAGLVLFELLAGKGPFDDDPGVGLSRCFKVAPLLSEIVPNTPPELSAIIARALEQDPARRPPAGALASELRRVSAELRAAPGAAEDEAIRAEVDDLLRRMPPPDAAPRPAAGRMPTPDPAFADPNLPRDATSAPQTPLMGNAPGRVPSGLEATMASSGEGAGNGAFGMRPAAGLPASSSNRAPLQPHLAIPGVGIASQRGSVAGAPPHPGGPIQVARHGSAPGAASAAPHALSTPQSPRLAPSGVQGGQPLFGSTLAVRSGSLHDSAPHAPAVTGDVSTSPGVYATVDNLNGASAPRIPTRTPWAAIVGGGVGVLLVLALAGGAFVMRKKGDPDSSSSASTTPIATATATAATPSAVASAPVAITTPASASASAAPTASASSSSTTTGAGATAAKPTRPVVPSPTPNGHATAASATTTAKLPPPTPRGASSTPSDKGGYVNW